MKQLSPTVKLLSGVPHPADGCKSATLGAWVRTIEEGLTAEVATRGDNLIPIASRNPDEIGRWKLSFSEHQDCYQSGLDSQPKLNRRSGRDRYGTTVPR